MKNQILRLHGLGVIVNYCFGIYHSETKKKLFLAENQHWSKIKLFLSRWLLGGELHLQFISIQFKVAN